MEILSGELYNNIHKQQWTHNEVKLPLNGETSSTTDSGSHNTTAAAFLKQCSHELIPEKSATRLGGVSSWSQRFQ